MTSGVCLTNQVAIAHELGKFNEKINDNSNKEQPNPGGLNVSVFPSCLVYFKGLPVDHGLFKKRGENIHL